MTDTPAHDRPVPVTGGARGPGPAPGEPRGPGPAPAGRGRHRRRRPGSRRYAIVTLAGALLAGAGLGLLVGGGAEGRPEPVGAPPVSRSVTPGAATAAPAPVADPVRIRIPRIGVAAELVRIGVDGAGILQPPSTADVAGWFAGGARPGGPGPAVIAGHVDSRSGPGVFFALRELRPGDGVEVVDTNGRTWRFTVQYVEQTGKDAFPTRQVYGPTPVPELRLVTCGGEFVRGTGSYRDNLIVHATLG